MTQVYVRSQILSNISMELFGMMQNSFHDASYFTTVWNILRSRHGSSSWSKNELYGFVIHELQHDECRDIFFTLTQ